MMKPKFDDVLEYVRNGEDDPEMLQILDHAPGGQELLKQARFICKALRERYGDRGRGRFIAASAEAPEALQNFDLVAKREPMRSPEERESRTFYQSARSPRLGKKQTPSLNRMFAGIESEGQDLGTLIFAIDEDQVSVSYQPSEVVAFFAKKFGSKVTDLQQGLPRTQILSLNINISLPVAIAVGRQVTLQLSSGLEQRPARYLDLVFMPDAGPFVRLQSDHQGRVVLPEPIRSGILRIETDSAQFLRVQVEEP